MFIRWKNDFNVSKLVIIIAQAEREKNRMRGKGLIKKKDYLPGATLSNRGTTPKYNKNMKIDFK